MTLDEYILDHSDEEGALLSALNRDANVNLLRPRMLSGHLQGRILKMFCRMLRPRRVNRDLHRLRHALPGRRNRRRRPDPYTRDQ